MRPHRACYHAICCVIFAAGMMAVAAPSATAMARRPHRQMVKLHTEPLLFSPNGDGIKDTVILAPHLPGVSRVRSWELVIQDSRQTEVRRFTGGSTPPTYVVWDGKDAAGQVVQEGEYTAVFRAVRSRRWQLESSTVTIPVDNTPPAISVSVSPLSLIAGGEAPNDQLTCHVSAADIHGIERWRVEVLDGANHVVRVFGTSGAQRADTPSDPSSIIWDGTEEATRQLVPPGPYAVQARVWDRAGNQGVSTKVTFQVLAASHPKGNPSAKVPPQHFELASPSHPAMGGAVP